MQMTSGAVRRSKPENVSEPEHPLKLCPMVMLVTFSSEETVKEIGMPCDVVPFHCPAREGAAVEGLVGLLHALESTHASNTTAVCSRLDMVACFGFPARILLPPLLRNPEGCSEFF